MWPNIRNLSVFYESGPRGSFDIEASWFKYTCMSYIVFGFILICANTLITCDILRHRALRMKKEYLILAGLVFADCLYEAATFIAGIYRIKLISLNEYRHQISRWDCVWTPHFVLLTFSATAQVGMFLIIGIDRLIAISQPFKYISFTRKYSLSMVGICFTLAIIYTAFMVLNIFISVFNDAGNREEMVNGMCLTTDVDKVSDSYFYVRVGTAGFSIVIYIIAWLLYRKYQRKLIADEGFSSTVDRLQQFQRRLTTSFGICTMFTFGLFILPLCLPFIANRRHSSADFVGPLSWILNCCNAVVNLFVYSIRHQDIRVGLKLLFTGRELIRSPSRRVSTETTVFLIS